MNKVLATAALLAMTTSPLLAGSLSDPVVEAPVMAPAPVMAQGADWTGAYAGVQLGYGDLDSNGAGLDGSGAIGGVHAGYRQDFGTFVAGAELDYDITDIDLGDGLGSLDSVARLKLIGGADLGRTFLYGTLGAAYAKADVDGSTLSDNGTFYGIGADYAVTDQWTVGGEVLRHEFSDFDGSGVDLDANTFKAKVSYRF